MPWSTLRLHFPYFGNPYLRIRMPCRRRRQSLSFLMAPTPPTRCYAIALSPCCHTLLRAHQLSFAFYLTFLNCPPGQLSSILWHRAISQMLSFSEQLYPTLSTHPALSKPTTMHYWHHGSHAQNARQLSTFFT